VLGDLCVLGEGADTGEACAFVGVRLPAGDVA
jgi:hypothetical protein